MKHLLFLFLFFPSLLFGQVRGFMLTKPTGGGGGPTVKAVTVDHTQIANTDQTAFPVQFSFSRAYLKTVANGGGVQNASGYDIRFWADAGMTTAIPWEVVKYDGSAGTISGTFTADVSHTTDKVVYLSYGDASVTTFHGSDAGNVWPASALRVWHMDDVLTGSGQTIKDWTGNGNMTSAGSWTSAQSVAGKIGNGLKLLSSNSTNATFSSLALTSTYTVELWASATSGTVDGNTFTLESSSTGDLIAFGNPAGFFGLFSGNGTNKIQDGSAVSGNTFYHFVFTRNGTTWTMYQNGAQTVTNSSGINVAFDGLGIFFGSNTNDVIVDEIKIYNVAATADQVTDRYNNGNTLSTFVTLAP